MVPTSLGIRTKRRKKQKSLKGRVNGASKDVTGTLSAYSLGWECDFSFAQLY